MKIRGSEKGKINIFIKILLMLLKIHNNFSFKFNCYYILNLVLYKNISKFLFKIEW